MPLASSITLNILHFLDRVIVKKNVVLNFSAAFGAACW